MPWPFRRRFPDHYIPAVHRHVRWTFGEMIDDGFTFYKSKYLCFNCQKAFRPPDRTLSLRQCPTCGSEVKCVGPMFKVPRKLDNRSWKQLRKRLT